MKNREIRSIPLEEIKQDKTVLSDLNLFVFSPAKSIAGILTQMESCLCLGQDTSKYLGFVFGKELENRISRATIALKYLLFGLEARNKKEICDSLLVCPNNEFVGNFFKEHRLNNQSLVDAVVGTLNYLSEKSLPIDWPKKLFFPNSEEEKIKKMQEFVGKMKKDGYTLKYLKDGILIFSSQEGKLVGCTELDFFV